MGRINPVEEVKVTKRKPSKRRQQVLSPKVSKLIQEMRSHAKRSRFRKWVCSECGQIARIASSRKHPGVIKHISRMENGNAVPCGGTFVEVI